MDYIPIGIVSIVLIFAHYFGDQIYRLFSKINTLSFAVGVSVSYIFLDMFPRISEISYNRSVFFYVLLGFSVFHITEKLIYYHKVSSRKRLSELHMAHSVLFFIYHFSIGMVLVHLFNVSIAAGLSFSLPVILHTLIGTGSLENMHHKIREKISLKSILSSSTLFGSIVAILFPIGQVYYNMILGFVVGSIIFAVIKDSLPEGKRGNPLFFIFGALLFSILIGIIWKIGL